MRTLYPDLQPFDTGSIGPSRVLDVVDEEDRVAHIVDRALEPGWHACQAECEGDCG